MRLPTPARCCCCQWLSVDCCYYNNRIVLLLSPLACTCRCCYCTIMLLVSPPANCCYIDNRILLSLSLCAHQGWYCKIMLPLLWVNCCYLDIRNFLSPSLACMCCTDADTARWWCCCCCRRQMIVEFWFNIGTFPGAIARTIPNLYWQAVARCVAEAVAKAIANSSSNPSQQPESYLMLKPNFAIDRTIPGTITRAITPFTLGTLVWIFSEAIAKAVARTFPEAVTKAIEWTFPEAVA